MCIVCEIKADLSKTKATAEQAAAIMANVEKLARAMGGVIDVVEAAHARKPDVFKPEELATIAEAEELFAQSEDLPPLAAAIPKGYPGECFFCGEEFARVVEVTDPRSGERVDSCGRCRDARGIA